jgi:DtxR family Mn-dependent transcriptional regulator
MPRDSWRTRSPKLEAKIDAELDPTHDPHGDPIPDSDLRVSEERDRSLCDVGVGERVRVSRVPDADPALLRYLSELGLVPGSVIELVSFAPFAGPVGVRTTTGEQGRGMRCLNPSRPIGLRQSKRAPASRMRRRFGLRSPMQAAPP